MDHYHKAETHVLATWSDDVIRIGQHAKVSQTVQKVLERLKRDGRVSFVGVGRAVTKAVTVAEITKRQAATELKHTPVSQDNSIFFTSIEETWRPNASEDASLDSLIVTREQPTILIDLAALVDQARPNVQHKAEGVEQYRPEPDVS